MTHPLTTMNVRAASGLVMPVTSRERPYDLAARGPGVARAHSLKYPDRTISLGTSAGVRLTSAAAGGRSGDLVREYPRSTPGDLPIGHVAGTGQGWA